MKTHIALILAGLIIVAGCAQQRTTLPAPTMPADPTLYILLDKTQGEITMDEEHLLTTAIETVFAEQAFPRTFVVRRHGRGAAPEGATSLILNIVEWQQSIPNQIDSRIAASLRQGEVRHDLGVARGQQSGLATAMGPTGVNEIFEQAAANAIRNLYPVLMQYLNGVRPAGTGERPTVQPRTGPDRR